MKRSRSTGSSDSSESQPRRRSPSSAKPAQIALAWLLAKPTVAAPIVGATKLEHLDDAIAAVDLELSESDIQLVEAPYRAHPVKGLGPSASLDRLRR